MHTRRGDSRCQGITDVDFTHIAITVKSEPEPNIFNLYRTIFPPDSLILSPVPTLPSPQTPHPPKTQGRPRPREQAKGERHLLSFEPVVLPVPVPLYERSSLLLLCLLLRRFALIRFHL